MLRVLLAMMLMAMLAMPHGICLCHHFQASSAQDAYCHNEIEPPTNPADQPDDHDCDCGCELREELACGSTAGKAERDDAANFDWAGRLCFSGDTAASIAMPSFLSFQSPNGPVALILCALRI